jgi:hypothetical protein
MRITPTLAFILIAYLSVADLIVQRSPYAFHKDLVEPCLSYWWAALLHIQNQVNPPTTVCSLKFDEQLLHLSVIAVSSLDLVHRR